MNPSIINYNNPIRDNTASNIHHLPFPKIASNVFIGPNSAIIGEVIIKGPAFIGFNNVVRADYGCRFFIGPGTSINDQCFIYGSQNKYSSMGEHNWTIYIEGNVSLLHGAAIHGPCRIGKNSFIGQNVSIFDSRIGENCVIMHGASIGGGVIIPDGRFIEADKLVVRQEDADRLPAVPGEYLSLNPETIKGYMELAEEYLGQEQFKKVF